MGYDHFMFVEPAPTEYICPLCQKVYSGASKGACGHVLCTGCWIKRKDKKIECPICPQKQKIDAGALILDTPINDAVRNLMTCCDYEGCSEHIPLRERDEHLKVCKHRNDIKRTTIKSDQSDTESESMFNIKDKEEEEDAARRKTRRKRKRLTLLAASLCIYFVFSYFGIPVDPYIWCGVSKIGHLETASNESTSNEISKLIEEP